MRSDVPVGSCLSGGLDSSSIVCLANNMTDIDRPYHVFTGRFPASDADEWVWAKKVIAETSVKPHVVAPTAKDLLRDLNDFVWHNELPVGSSSQFAQWSVFRLAKENGITVLLDGQGGDELLGGYEQYFEKFLASTNSITRAEIRKIKKRYPLALLTNVQKLTNSLPQKLRHFLAGLSGRGSDFSFGLTSELASRLNKRLSRIQTKGSQFNPLVAQLYEEMLHTHLPVLLRYGDRNSMAHSTEVRLPFCDHRLAEFVFSLPVDFLMGGAQTKRMLRGAMKGVLPEDIRTRWGKQGFIPPQENWFKEELGTSVTEIINDHSFKHSKIWRQKWWLNVLERFHSGENHLAAILWRPVINNAWERNFLSRVNSIKKVSIKRDL